MHLWVGGLPRRPGGCVSGGPGRGWGRGLVGHGLVEAPRWFLLLAVPGRLFCFGSLVVFGCGALLFVVVRVVCGCGNKWKWLLGVGLACGRLFGGLLFAWLSLVMSMMVSFVLSFFPRDVLDEILNLIESVSEDFPSYSHTSKFS